MSSELKKVLCTLEKYDSDLYRNIYDIKLNIHNIEIERIIGISKIRSEIQSSKGNLNIGNQFQKLYEDLEGCSKIYKKVRIVTFKVNNMINIYYLNPDLDKVLGVVNDIINENSLDT